MYPDSWWSVVGIMWARLSRGLGRPCPVSRRSRRTFLLRLAYLSGHLHRARYTGIAPFAHQRTFDSARTMDARGPSVRLFGSPSLGRRAHRETRGALRNRRTRPIVINVIAPADWKIADITRYGPPCPPQARNVMATSAIVKAATKIPTPSSTTPRHFDRSCLCTRPFSDVLNG